jgi:hypothetical protein
VSHARRRASPWAARIVTEHRRVLCFRLLILVAVVLALSGCVWLRLLSVRDQLREFDRFVEATGEPGLELRFREPVLLADDLDTLIQGCLLYTSDAADDM